MHLDDFDPIDHLWELPATFGQLYGDVIDLDYTLGTDAQLKIASLILRTHSLAAETINLLTELDQDRFAEVLGWTTVLETASKLVASTAQAGAELALALSTNPYRDVPILPSQQDVIPTEDRYSEEEYEMAGHQLEAANHLEDSADTCYELIGIVTRALQEHAVATVGSRPLAERLAKASGTTVPAPAPPAPRSPGRR
ncbi:hypothetical protein OG756_33855 [Streptomyces sp. NBC_01310]|uniref:hypothetical protein n=1 Tax=Streptomyces sp. NBC_01310 TaxID=2903820 RepID=UPI0035B5B6A1|nr:hypothetical protein OG756_33855 [Streptomyces sp. NBC_01310]